MILAVDMLGMQQRVVKCQKRIVALVAGGNRPVECSPTPADIIFRLLPELPFRSLDRIHLFERKIAPGDLQFVAQRTFHIFEP